MSENRKAAPSSINPWTGAIANRYPDGFEPLMVDGDGMLIYTLKLCYRKHVMMHDDVIGWDELSDTLGTTLAQVMGDDEFVKWKEGL
jgi:hypothetical protein